LRGAPCECGERVRETETTTDDNEDEEEVDVRARARYDNQTDPLINNDETSARGRCICRHRRRCVVVINGSNAAAAEKGMQILYIHCISRYYYYIISRARG